MILVPWFWEFVNFFCRLWLRLRYRIVVIEEASPPGGACLLLAKHAESADIPLFSVLCEKRQGARPYFQMGSFVGYRILGPLVPVLRRLGGFPVMRPKEVRRLGQRKGWDRRAALTRMKEVNEEAEAIRQEVLRGGGVLVVFPEGTRDSEGVRPLRSELEVRSALEVVGTGSEVSAWPVVVAYGRPRTFRRSLVVRLCPPFRLGGEVPTEVLARVEQIFRQHWLPDAAADELAATLRRGI